MLGQGPNTRRTPDDRPLLKTVDGAAAIADLMRDIGRRAKAAARVLALASAAQKDAALTAMAQEIRARAPEILAANAEDITEARNGGANSAFLDRLGLDARGVTAMADGLDTIRALADPVGTIAATAWTRPNGMSIERVRAALGVVGVIYESRPNVTAGIAGAPLPQGRQMPLILRGGSESLRLGTRHPRRRAWRRACTQGRPARGRHRALVPTRDRAAVGLMLAGGSTAAPGRDRCARRRAWSARVQAEARVPVFAHLEGVCHVYARQGRRCRPWRSRSVLNAKMRRTGICGAAETLLVDPAPWPTPIWRRSSPCCWKPAARCAATRPCKATPMRA